MDMIDFLVTGMLMNLDLSSQIIGGGARAWAAVRNAGSRGPTLARSAWATVRLRRTSPPMAALVAMPSQQALPRQAAAM
ncbi:MAG: hypothetical protein EPO23_02490 [Xanthobacteraceae bacterium]|nr:MAG: hypothetical protein EPO23_02490 [Xanthobacteraceae bacterium]